MSQPSPDGRRTRPVVSIPHPRTPADPPIDPSDCLRSIGVIDDHELVALAVGLLIDARDGLYYAGHTTTVDELETWTAVPDLVVLDLLLRDGSTPQQNVGRLRALGAHVLVLTSGDNRYLLREALRTDVRGVIRKSAPPEELIEAIDVASHGDDVVSAEWAITIDSDPLTTSAPLTDREREVLSLYASGIGAKTVARRLGITQNTVNDHLRRIKAHYQRQSRPAHTKVELYQRGVADGYLPIPEE